jgi:hypothetical protein
VRTLVLLFTVALCSGVVATVSAQESSCADCHFANPQADPAPDHLFDWEMSAHGRNNVGCEKCHGGDATTFESFMAHRGVLSSRNAASPTYRTNLPRTCGACHIGPFVEFQKSRHYALLEENDPNAPTCSTCHGPVAARLLSPRGLEQQCAGCHGPDDPMAERAFPTQGRFLLEDVTAIRTLLEPVPRLLRRVKDEARRRELEQDYEQAQVPLTEAVQAAHAFVFDRLEDRLSTARQRAETLLNELANPD